MKTLLTFLTVLLIPLLALAQSGISASYIRMTPTGLPGTCTLGDIRFDVATSTLKFCSGSNTWTSSAGASGSASAYSVLGNNTSSAAPASSLQSLIIGAPGYSDSGIATQITGSLNGYYQQILQNTSNGTGASADFVLSNNLGTANTYYGDFGINSSTFTGSGSLNIPNATYIYSQTGDLTLATATSNSIHLLTNSATTDAMTIGTTGLITVPAFSSPGVLTNNSSGLLSSSSYTALTALLNPCTASLQGLVPAVGTATGKFFRDDCTWQAVSGSGTVTTVSVATANGFGGTVANATTTPAITLTTGVSGVLKGSSSALVAATAGTDYSAGTSALATGIVKSTTATGALTIATSGTDYVLPTGNISGTAAGLSATLAIASGGTAKTAVTTAPTASSWAGWDANSNFSAKNLIGGYTTTATAAGTTTLVVGSTYQQYFTGVTTQTVTLPVTSTLVLGQQYQIVNSSTGALTVNSSGANLVVTVPPSSAVVVTCILTSGTTAASWSSVSASGSPLTTAGDLYTYTTTNARLPIGTTGQILAVSGGSPAWVNSSGVASATTPTISKATVAGSAAGTGGFSGGTNYVTPANVQFIRVRLVGGGGGGSGSGTSNTGGIGGNGSATTFGTSLLTANGGAGAAGVGSLVGGGGGATTALGSGAIGTTIAGANGLSGTQTNVSTVYCSPGAGAVSYFGGSGSNGAPGGGGYGPSTNSGSGGGGGGGASISGTFNCGAGGGAGAYVEAVIAITSSGQTFPFSVGAFGTAGAAGTSGFVGGAGSLGYIEVTEYYYGGTGSGGYVNNTMSKATAAGTASGTGGFVSGTYTTPSNVVAMHVRAVGGGGGGSGSGSSGAGGTGGAGGNTAFGTSLLVANGGTGGSDANGNSPGSGGSASVTAPAIGTALTGGSGSAGGNLNISSFYTGGGSGGSTAFGGGAGSASSGAGTAAPANTGAGGGGAQGTGTATGTAGSGGGAGGYVDAWVYPTTNQTFSYSVGAAGTAGTAGTSGFAGGAGALGYIEVTEYYANGAVGTATTLTGQVTPSNLPGQGIPFLTSSGGTYTTLSTSSASTIYQYTIIAGGGGGGGANITNGAGGGGGAGGIAQGYFSGVAASTALTATVGSGGAGGSASGSTGSTGGSSSISGTGMTTITCTGGIGGTGATTTATSAGGSGGTCTGGSNSPLFTSGSAGQQGTANLLAGTGGFGMYGGSAWGVKPSQTLLNTGTQWGSGGGGNVGTGSPGSLGGGGLIIITQMTP